MNTVLCQVHQEIVVLLYEYGCFLLPLSSLVQVKTAVNMLHTKVLSLKPFEGWLVSERHRKAQEEAESKDLEADAVAQVDRLRERWCIGSGKSLGAVSTVACASSLDSFARVARAVYASDTPSLSARACTLDVECCR